MTRRYAWVAVLVFAMAGARAQAPAAPADAASADAARAARASAPSAAAGDLVVWLEPGAAEVPPNMMLVVNCAHPQRADAPIDFECLLQSEGRSGEAQLQVEVKDPSGTLLYRAKRPAAIGKESSVYHMEWDARDASAGVYTAILSILRLSGMEAARRDCRVVKAAPSALQAELEAIRPRFKALQGEVQRVESSGGVSPYVRVRMVLLRDRLSVAESACAERDWPGLSRELGFLHQTLDGVSGQLPFRDLVPELWESVPDLDLSTLQVSSGGFTSAGRPVFLFGVNFNDGLKGADSVARVRDWGLNLLAFSMGPNAILPNPNETADPAAKLDPVFRAADEKHVSVMVSLDPGSMAPWVTHQTPGLGESGAVDITQPAAKAIIERHVSVLAPYLAKQQALTVLDLAHNLRFKFTGEDVRLGFLDAMRSRYADRLALNRAWKGLFADIAELDIGWNRVNPRYQDSPAYRYDWQTHQQQLGSEYVEWLRVLVRAAAPRTPLALAADDKAFDLNESEYGVDRETLTGMLDVNACCASNQHLDPYYAMGYPQECLTYAFLRSLSPGKPLVAFEDAFIHEDVSKAPATFDYVHALMWDAAITGLDASALAGDPIVSMRPECLDGYVTAALDINRLAPIVTAFQQAPAEVSVLWSMPSKIHSGGVPYLQSARFAFEGASFAGYNVRFITEKQCIDGGLADVKVLVVPDTPAVSDEAFAHLKEHIQSGKTVIRTASSILYDEHGHSRRDIISNTYRTVLARGQNMPTEYLHAMDAVTAFGDLPLIPRTTNEYGYPLEGVKSRYVEVNGEGYFYVVNFRTEPAHVWVRDAVGDGRDLVLGRDVTFPAQLQPLDPMLIRVKPQPESATVPARPEPKK